MSSQENTSQRHAEDLARELIESQSTMALATARDNQSWVAPVYYVFYQGGFYFFSAPDSRHIQEAMQSYGQASAAIYPFVSSWQEIRGLQMSGTIKKAEKTLRTLQALKAYIQKYPFVGEFFDPGQGLSLDNFIQRFRVRFYFFRPDLVYYMDNQIRFGYRVEVQLQGA